MATFGKKGVLIVNLGTPDAPTRGAVYRYLKEFLLDRRVIDIPWLFRNALVRGIIAPFRSGPSSKLYKMVWTENGSPLKHYAEVLVDGVRKQLGEDYQVELGMRYQKPSLESALQRLLDAQCSEIKVFTLFPHYASASVGSVHDEVMRILRKQETIPNLQLINSYYDLPALIDIFVENARKFDIDSYDHILFSYHGLPQRQLRKANSCNHCLQTADCCANISIENQFCYSAQCHGTTKAIVEKLDLKEGQYTTCYQSRLGRDPWVQPYTIKVIEELAAKGAKRILVFSPAFTADCLETIIEISDEYQEEFREMGGETMDLVPSLNDNPKWIKAVAEMVR